MFLEICVCVLMIILFIAQLFLAIRQIRKKTYDGKILLIIDIAVMALWIPLSIALFITKLTVIKIIWYILSAGYMFFTMWYTNNLQREMHH